MRTGLLLIACALALSACGAPTDGRYVGQMTGEGPAPCPGGHAVLLLHGTEARFIPDEGIVVLDGTLSPDGTVAAAAERGGARRSGTPGEGAKGGREGSAPAGPFRMVFQGKLDGNRVTGTYGTPRCRGHVELSPG